MASTAAPRPIPEGLPRQGDILAGKYQIEGLLGMGGMGVVVSAFHVSLRQRVAVKFLLPSGARLPDASARFLREAQSAVAIQSEHVTRVLDVGTLEDGSPYTVMEHLSGSDFSSLLKARGLLPPAEALGLVLQACEAIAEAHALGIVHRDLKLTNLFVTKRSDGSPLVKVLDFGLSKVLAPEVGSALEESMTMTNIVVGSPHYMSPEQIRSLKHVDARTDIWALGVILYQLLTGRRPFFGENLPAVCMSIAVDAPPPLRSIVPDLPPALEEIVLRCLEKVPSQRVQSVAELARGLLPFAPPLAQVSVERIVNVTAAAPAIASVRGSSVVPASTATLPSAGAGHHGGRPSIPPAPAGPAGVAELPGPPESVWGPQPTTRDQREFLPWLRTFDAFVRERRYGYKLGDASIAQVVAARISLDDAVAEQTQAARVAEDAAEALLSARAELAAAEERRVAAPDAVAAAIALEAQALQQAQRWLLPIVERLLEHDDMTNAVRRQMGILPSPTSAPPLPTYLLADDAPSGISVAFDLHPPGARPPTGLLGVPANVVVVAHPNRVNLLTWLGDDAPGTRFLIEAAVGTLYRGTAVDPDPNAYKLVATVAGETTYKHTVRKSPAGVRVRYRIRAERHGAQSPFSSEVTVACK